MRHRYTHLLSTTTVTLTLAALLPACVDADRCSSSQPVSPSVFGDQQCTDVFVVALFGAFILVAAIWKAIADRC